MTNGNPETIDPALRLLKLLQKAKTIGGGNISIAAAYTKLFDLARRKAITKYTGSLG